MWVVKIGRVDIITKVSKRASQMAMPRDGHIEAVLHVFTFIRQKYKSIMEFYPTHPVINMSDFQECKWQYFYGDLNEATPPNAPKEGGI